MPSSESPVDAIAVIEGEHTVAAKPWNGRLGVGGLQTPSPSDGRPTPGGPLPQTPMTAQIWQDYIDSGHFPINYSSKIHEVCTRAVEYVIHKSKSLDIICRRWAPTAAGQGPSWIRTRIDAPFNISADGIYERVEADPFVGHGLSHGRVYHAAGDSEVQDFKIQESGGFVSLSATGFILDAVGRKGSSATRAVIPADWMKLGDWEDLMDLPSDPFWRVLVGNRGQNHRTAPGYYRHIFQYLMQQRSGAGRIIELNTEDLINNGGLPLIANEFLKRVRSVIWSRRLIETSKKGILGLGPKGTKKGDM